MPHSTAFEIKKLASTLSQEYITTLQVNLSYLSHVAYIRYGGRFQVRDDSRLAFMWAKSQCGLSAEEVVDELYFVDQLYSDARFKDDVETNMRRIAEALKNRYKLTWSETWDLTKKYGSDLLKINHVLHTMSSENSQS